MIGPNVVSLVGGGPGDPDLVTIRGRDRLERADLVVCGAAALEAARAHARESAEILVVGEDGSPALPSARVPSVLAERVRSGERTVRLYAGDPFTLGRGSEEAAELRRSSIGFEVVPGIPPLVAAAAFAGIPLRGGGASGGVSLRGGAGKRERTGAANPAGGETDGGAVALEGDGAELRRGATRLLVEGWSPGAPAAVVARAGTPEQEVRGGDLAGLADGGLRPVGEGRDRAAAMVGRGVAEREVLAWMEKRPLFGRRVVVTRPEAQAESFCRALADLGARPVRFPTIRIDPAPDPGPLEASLRDTERYDWVVFTSVNGVRAVAAVLDRVGRDSRAFGGARIAAIGPGTAAELGRLSLRADVVPGEYRAEALVEAMLEADPEMEGRRILLPRAAEARAVLPERLAEAGARVDERVAYVTRGAPREEAGRLRARLDRGEIDWLTFTASSTVRHFVERVGSDPGKARVATIGPITAGTARNRGLRVDVVAAEYTVSGLLRALVRAEASGDETDGAGDG